jgi:hypothetical protein
MKSLLRRTASAFRQPRPFESPMTRRNILLIVLAKSARHARDSLVPQHGTLLRVSADGSETKILANGFRAANGVCVNPDGSFFVTDQEGHWNPMNRINRVTEGGFYGKVFVVPHEQVDGHWQGGMCRLPLPQFPTGVMRARFHPGNGQMYACGMHAWGSDQSESPGGLYRIRYTGRASLLLIGLAAHASGITITFTQPVDPQSASRIDNYLVDTWGLKRSANYGSDRYDEKSLRITSAKVSADRRSVTLRIPDIRSTWCMQISYKLRNASGKTFTGTIQNTVHRLSASAPGN